MLKKQISELEMKTKKLNRLLDSEKQGLVLHIGKCAMLKTEISLFWNSFCPMFVYFLLKLEIRVGHIEGFILI